MLFLDNFLNWLKGLRISVFIVIGSLSLGPEAVWARPGELSLVIDAGPVPDFGQLVREAEVVLARGISQAFSSDLTLTRLHVQILADRNGAIAPLMTTEVSRADWQRDSRIARWTEYFSSAEILLSYVTITDSSPDSASSEPEVSEFPQPQEQIQLQDNLD